MTVVFPCLSWNMLQVLSLLTAGLLLLLVAFMLVPVGPSAAAPAPGLAGGGAVAAIQRLTAAAAIPTVQVGNWLFCISVVPSTG